MDIKEIDANFKTKKDITNELKSRHFKEKELLMYDLDVVNYMERKRLSSDLLTRDINYIKDMIKQNNRTKKVVNNIIDILYLDYLLSFSRKVCADWIYKEIKKGNGNIRAYDIQKINNKVFY